MRARREFTVAVMDMLMRSASNSLLAGSRCSSMQVLSFTWVQTANEIGFEARLPTTLCGWTARTKQWQRVRFRGAGYPRRGWKDGSKAILSICFVQATLGISAWRTLCCTNVECSTWKGSSGSSLTWLWDTERTSSTFTGMLPQALCGIGEPLRRSREAQQVVLLLQARTTRLRRNPFKRAGIPLYTGNE